MMKEKNQNKFLSKINAIWHKFLSFFNKGVSSSHNFKTHSKFGALVAVQYRDKVDTSWTKSTKTIIQKLVFIIIKFVLIFVAVYAILLIVAKLFMIRTSIMNFFLIFLGIYSVLNLITVTFGLVKSLYHAEDNKVLATYPTSSSTLFLSKILVFELFELKKSFDILLPITLGFLFAGVQFKIIPLVVLVWAIFPLFLIITITVLLGALLSIPALYFYNFLKKYTVAEIVTLLVVASAAIYGLVYVINLIPENKGDIDINKSYAVIKQAIDNFALIFAKVVYPVNYAYRAIVGESGSYIMNKLLPITFARFGIMILCAGVLFGLVFLIIKPFYFVMMTKTFEFNKEIIDNPKKNKTHNKYFTFIIKEFKLTLRDLDITGSYLGVYIAAPILLLFIDKIFMAMSTNAKGDLMIAAFNVLLITLPLLASSTVIATIYSREGRTAYIKKTKPIKPYFPLTSKLFFNMILVIPSILACSYIFVKFTNTNIFCGVLLTITVLSLQYGHIFLSASYDLMNPQNEVYATEGTSISNPNERKSTVVAFLLSIVFALVGFVFFRETYAKTESLNGAFIKLALMALAFAISCIVLYFLKIKALYLERQEASRE